MANSTTNNRADRKWSQKSGTTIALENLKTPISAGGFGLSDLKKQLLGRQASWMLSALQGEEDYAKLMREFLENIATTLKEAVSRNQGNLTDNNTELNFHWCNIFIGDLLNYTSKPKQ